MASKLVARASKEGSWQAALDFAGEKYSGVDLNFILAEINKAKDLAENHRLSAPETAMASVTETPAMPLPEAKSHGKTTTETANAAVV